MSKGMDAADGQHQEGWCPPGQSRFRQTCKRRAEHDEERANSSRNLFDFFRYSSHDIDDQFFHRAKM